VTVLELVLPPVFLIAGLWMMRSGDGSARTFGLVLVVAALACVMLFAYVIYQESS
jgi:hypothetical protein